MSRAATQRCVLLTASAFLSGALVLSGCSMAGHPDDKAAIYRQFGQNDLASVIVSQDQDKGIITLSGIVGNSNQKSLAQNLAQQSAPGYTVANNIQIQSAGLQGMIQSATRDAALDSKIEKQFRSEIASDPYLRHQRIRSTTSDATIYLQGAVGSYQERTKAEALARRVPRVQSVVNELQIAQSPQGSQTAALH